MGKGLQKAIILFHSCMWLLQEYVWLVYIQYRGFTFCWCDCLCSEPRIFVGPSPSHWLCIDPDPVLDWSAYSGMLVSASRIPWKTAVAAVSYNVLQHYSCGDNSGWVHKLLNGAWHAHGQEKGINLPKGATKRSAWKLFSLQSSLLA